METFVQFSERFPSPTIQNIYKISISLILFLPFPDSKKVVYFRYRRKEMELRIKMKKGELFEV